jgi:hypothetical protein
VGVFQDEVVNKTDERQVRQINRIDYIYTGGVFRSMASPLQMLRRRKGKGHRTTGHQGPRGGVEV